MTVYSILRPIRKIVFSGLFIAAFVIVVPLYAIGLSLYVFAEWLGATVSMWRQDKED